ncbi:Ankyrin repeat domain-containing protein 7, partial [Ophiophagus hannah]
MKKVKKILGLGRKKNGQQSPLRSRVVACASAPGALICSGGDGYNLQNKDLSKLHRAAAEGDLGELRHLLQKHDLNEQDKAGRTPLHFACANGYTDIVTFLVDNKCQLDSCDKEKRSPLMKAVECQQEFCAIYLLEHGADPNLKDIDNNTALHFAACNSSVSLAKYLLEKKADIEAQNKDGCTPIPLLIAASNKKRDLTHVLLLHGSNVAHRDKSGWSAKDYAMISDDSIKEEFYGKRKEEKKNEEEEEEEEEAAQRQPQSPSCQLRKKGNGEEQQPPSPDAGREELQLFCAAWLSCAVQLATHLTAQWRQRGGVPVPTAIVIPAQEGQQYIEHKSIKEFKSKSKLWIMEPSIYPAKSVNRKNK